MKIQNLEPNTRSTIHYDKIIWNMKSSSKVQKTFKIKKKLIKNPVLSTPVSPRVIKVAKKLSPSPTNYPMPTSVQEDFVLETDGNAEKFLSGCSQNQEYEIYTSRIRSLSPTDIIGPPGKFVVNPVKRILPTIPKVIVKHLTLTRILKKPVTPTLEQKLTERKRKFNEDYEKKSGLIDTLPEGTFARQYRSLEKFEHQREYWQRLEANLIDRLDKHPEELQLNSAKIYEARQREVDIIDRLHKTNEIPERGYWKESLRTGTEEEKYFKHNSPDIRKTRDLENKYKTELLFYTKSPGFGRKQLKGSDYFQEKLKTYSRDKEEILNYVDGQELLVQGVNKIQLEYDAARRAGPKLVTLPPIEFFNEQIIEKNYEARVVPISPCNG